MNHNMSDKSHVLKQETVNENGLKTTVTFVKSGDRVLKTTKREKKISKHVIERKAWKPFGEAIKNNKCTFIDQVTFITDPNEDVRKDPELNATRTMNTFTPSTYAIEQPTYKPPVILREKQENTRANHFNKDAFVTVKISNIPDTLTEKWLRTLGNKHGRVMRCKIPKNQHGQPLNFAFVSYTNTREANAFLKYIKGKSMEYCILDAQITVR